MSQISKYFETIDKYLNSELSETELSELENNMTINSELIEEYNLQLDVQNAIQESDIINLREKLNKITKNQAIPCDRPNPLTSNTFNFGLADELTSPSNLEEPISMDDVLGFTDTFPKVHLYQHLMAAKENIYHFYKEQFEGHSPKKDQESLTDLDDALFEDIKDALKENDVLDLRANLKQIASRGSHSAHSLKDIHNYVDETMDWEQIAQFEEKLKTDKNLANDVLLFKEIDFAMAETDIMDLRASMQQIQRSSTKFKSGLEEIDGYLYDELSESQLALFEAELANNKNLYSEVDLVKNIDMAIQEKDIMELRNSLNNIVNENKKEKKTEQSLAGRFQSKRIAHSVVAASLILAMGITALIRYTSEEPIYQKYYTTYETAGISRSSNSTPDQAFALALQKYNSQDYQTALNLLQEVISRDQDNIASHFYSATSLQELGKYKNAIEEYQVVIVDKDNLFIEQAEWYIGLCYLQIKEDEKAFKQFKKILKNKGFYHQKAEAILRKIKNKI